MASSSKSMIILRRKGSGIESPHETEAVVHILIVEVEKTQKKWKVRICFCFPGSFYHRRRQERDKRRLLQSQYREGERENQNNTQHSQVQDWQMTSLTLTCLLPLLSPNWREALNLTWCKRSDHRLLVELWDWNRGLGDDFLGRFARNFECQDQTRRIFFLSHYSIQLQCASNLF